MNINMLIYIVGVLLYSFALLGLLGSHDDPCSSILQVVHGLPCGLDHRVHLQSSQCLHGARQDPGVCGCHSPVSCY